MKGVMNMQTKNLQDYIVYDDNKFTKRLIFKEKDHAAFMLNFTGGQMLPAHKHPGATLYIVVLQGVGSFQIDGEKIPVEKDSIIQCNGDEELAFVNEENTETSLYVVMHTIPDSSYVENR